MLVDPGRKVNWLCLEGDQLEMGRPGMEGGMGKEERKD